MDAFSQYSFPLGFADIIFGTLATTLATIVMYKVSNLYIGAIAGAVINGIIVGGELYFILHLPFFMNMFYVFVGEFIVLLVRMFSNLKKYKSTIDFMQKYILS